MNRLLDVLETLLSFSKYFLFNTFSQNIDKCSVAFSLLFSIHYKVISPIPLLFFLLFFSCTPVSNI